MKERKKGQRRQEKRERKDRRKREILVEREMERKE